MVRRHTEVTEVVEALSSVGGCNRQGVMVRRHMEVTDVV